MSLCLAFDLSPADTVSGLSNSEVSVNKDSSSQFFVKGRTQSFCLFLHIPFRTTSLGISCRSLPPSRYISGHCLPPPVPCVAWHLRATLSLELTILPQPSPALSKNRTRGVCFAFGVVQLHSQSMSQFGYELVALWLRCTNCPRRNPCHRYQRVYSAFT